MQKILRLLSLLLLAAGPAFAQRDIGIVEVVADTKTIPVRVYADTPDLNNLAMRAFKSHGR